MLRRRPRRPQGGLSGRRCRSALRSGQGARCASRFCRRARTRTISPAAAARRRSRRCSARRCRWSISSGCARLRARRWRRRSAVRGSNAGSPNSAARSATKPCAAIMPRIFKAALQHFSDPPAEPDRLRAGGARAGQRPRRDPFAFAPIAAPSYLATPPQIGLGLAQSPLLRPKSGGPSGREAIILLILLNSSEPAGELWRGACRTRSGERRRHHAA